MGASLESSRPIMAPSLSSKRASTRFSTYSMAPSVANTVKTSLSSASAHQEIKDIEEGLEKLENKKLATQRYVPSTEKSENLSKLALGAKLERALGRRMGGQDAVMRKRGVPKSMSVDNEKVLLNGGEKVAVA
ncbi:hypothetical protein N431DRAFT_500150 [Stipitochalara longipes BDJ]|nr:hypothetical protein N431DRAFT_500150 [Stipitochalara longipes BDJ]